MVGLDVGDGELLDLEHGGEDGALKGATSGHGLVGIEGGGGLLGKHFLDQSLDGRNPGASSNDLNAAL